MSASSPPKLATKKMPSLSNPELKLPTLRGLKLPSLGFGRSGGRRSGADLVGLDIQPGLVAAVQARVNGEGVTLSAVTIALANRFFSKGESDQLSTLTDLLSSSGRRAINLLTHDQLFSAKSASVKGVFCSSRNLRKFCITASSIANCLSTLWSMT